MTDPESVRERLSHVCWLGGGSGAGKSTIARRLAGAHGLTLCDTDALMGDHARRAAPADSPYLAAFLAMDMDERWLLRSPQAMLDTFHWFRGEGFDLIVEDLLRLPRDRGVLVEGFGLLPDLVRPLLADPRRAAWLLPAPAFREAAFTSRGSLWTIAGRTTDPPRALRNLLDRDAMFTERLAGDVRRLGLRGIAVDAPTTVDELAGRVGGAILQLD